MEMSMKKTSILFALPVAGSAVYAAAPTGPGAGGPPGAGGAGGITVEMVLTNNDENKDGTITKEEATKAARNLIQRWDAADLNKDNKVDAAELKKWVEAGAPGGPQGGAPGGAPGAPPAGAAPPAAK
jgi:hypothetical protein